MSIQEKCRILDHQKISSNYFKLILESAYISSHAEPGQFVNIRCGEKYDPLLRRPLSVHRASKEHKRFELLYEVVGKGTELLSNFSVGQELDVLGPLGKGFAIDEKKQIAILVGGGMGIAPLLELAGKIAENLPAGRHGPKSRKADSRIIALIGANIKQNVLCEKEFKDIGAEVIVATDDGSYGKRGFISDVLLELLENRLSASGYPLSVIFACGPKPMLKAVSEIAFQKKIDCQVSMESRMACGIGTCLGCVIKTKDGYKKVCNEGPVFNASEIIFAS